MNNFQSHISHVANTRAAQGSGGVSNAWIGVIFLGEIRSQTFVEGCTHVPLVIVCLVVTGTMEFYDFPIVLGMSSNPNCLSLHHFSEGWGSTTKQFYACEHTSKCFEKPKATDRHHQIFFDSPATPRGELLTVTWEFCPDWNIALR